MRTFILNDKLTVQDVERVARKYYPLELSSQHTQKILASAKFINQILTSGKKVYGITTGLGGLYNILIKPEDASQMNKNIIRSHACGVGETFSAEIVRAVLLLLINKLAQGYSGVRLQTIDILVELLNNDILPVVYQQGSVGSSGDLVPLAHLSLVLLGEGEATVSNTVISGRKALSLIKRQPIKPMPREGLALVNGTEVLTAISALNIYDAETIMKTADIAASFTMTALGCQTKAFDARIHQLKPHPGQLTVAANFRTLVKPDTSKDVPVQNAYSLRCAPQVHGASRDTIDYVYRQIEIELNSVTDNPLVFADTSEILSGGNFHGQSLGIPMDCLAIALSEFADISERRIDRLVNKNLNGILPPFLAQNPGLNSGFMIPQYVAAALVSENKILAHPASVDSIPTSAGQEDHVSMASIAARKCRSIVDNVEQVLAIELIVAAQALDLRKKYTIASPLKRVYKFIRQYVPLLKKDVVLSSYMRKVKELIHERKIIDSLGIDIA